MSKTKHRHAFPGSSPSRRRGPRITSRTQTAAAPREVLPALTDLTVLDCLRRLADSADEVTATKRDVGLRCGISSDRAGAALRRLADSGRIVRLGEAVWRVQP